MSNTYGGLINRPSALQPDTGSTYTGVWALHEHHEQRKEGKFGGSNPYSGINYLSTTVLHLVPGTIGDTQIIDGTGNCEIYQAADQQKTLGEFYTTADYLSVYYSAEQVKYGPTSMRFSPSSSCTILYNNKLDLSTGDWTIEWWEYTMWADYGCIVRLGLPGSYASIMIGLAINADYYRSYISTNANAWAVNAVTMGTGSWNQWTHYAMTRDTSGGLVRTYQNGYLKSITALSGATPIYWAKQNYTIHPPYPANTVDALADGYVEDFCISKRDKYIPPGKALVGDYIFAPSRITQ